MWDGWFADWTVCVCPYVCFGLSIENPSKIGPLRGWKPIVDVHKDRTVSFTYAVQRPTPSAGGFVRTKYLELLCTGTVVVRVAGPRSKYNGRVGWRHNIIDGYVSL